MFKDIQTQKTIGYGIKKGKLYYMDLKTKTSSRLQQALVVDCFGTDVWDMPYLVI